MSTEMPSQSSGIAKRCPDRIAGLSSERFANLRAIGQDPEIAYRTVISRIYSETVDYLNRLVREVREGKNVLPAADYVRWLQYSGLLELFSRFTLQGQNFPPLDRKLNDLLQECGEHFRGGRVAPKYDTSDIVEINRKLDVLLAANAQQVVTTVVTQVHTIPLRTNNESYEPSHVIARS